jgi:hypothetical protein
MEWQGAWTKENDYKKGAVVTNSGGTYVALLDVAKGSPAPPSDAWGVVAAPAPPSINWKGPWDAKTQYQINDVVSYSDSAELPPPRFELLRARLIHCRKGPASGC